MKLEIASANSNHLRDGTPDYTALDKYFLAGTESGETLLSSVIKMYTDIKDRTR